MMLSRQCTGLFIYARPTVVCERHHTRKTAQDLGLPQLLSGNELIVGKGEFLLMMMQRKQCTGLPIKARPTVGYERHHTR